MRDSNNLSGYLHPPAIAAVLNRTMFLTSVLVIAAVVSFASFSPRALVLPTISGLLTTFAFAAATVALLRGQGLANWHFTLWDVAAVWMFVALGAGMLSDPDAIEAYRQAVGEPAATETPAAVQPPAE